MLTVYTHSNNPLTKEFWKWVARKIIRKFSGPDAVRESLLRGLQGHHVPYMVNPLFPKGETAIVLSGTHALRAAIAHKQAGRITHVVAGPNIVAHPHDADNAMLHEAIDMILLPSQWTIDFWASESPNIAHKLKLWPAGVEIRDAGTRSGKPIIYNKRPRTTTAKEIANHLLKKGISTTTLTYGNFNQEEYFGLLTQAPYLVYISEVESQGLALQEAWSRDVPTFVAYSGHFSAPHGSWSDPKINAPYLTDTLGAFFRTETELDTLIDAQQTYHPKKYCDKHLSDYASVQNMLKVIQFKEAYYDPRKQEPT